MNVERSEIDFSKQLITPEGTVHEPVFNRDGLPLYTASVTAQYTEYSKKRICQLAASLQIRGIKLGGFGWLVNPSDVLEHKDTSRPGPKSKIR